MPKKFKLTRTSEKTIRLLYQIFYDLQRLLDREGISYFIIGGTALGAVRHGGIIPWDDDIDIGIDHRDMKRIPDLKKSLEKCGYNLVKVWLGYKVCYSNIPPIGRYKYSFPNIDIFGYEHYKGKVRLDRQSCRDIWPKEYFHVEELYPLRKYQFGDFEVWGPYKCKEYFNRIYGKKWNVEAYREYDHEIEEEVEKVLVKLTKQDRKPAQPTRIRKRNCI
jgi:phosphorylcholine metabolism protein LicD